MIIDAEVHLLHPEAQDKNFTMDEKEPMRSKIYDHPEFPLVQDKLSFTALLNSMERNDIGASVIMGMPWRDPGLMRDNNQFIAECVKAYPNKFRGMFIPHLSDVASAVKQISQVDSTVFYGIKLVPSWQGINIDDSSLLPIFRIIEERNMFLMVHTDHLFQSGEGDTAFRLFSMLARNPRIKVLAPHLGGLLCLYGLLPKVKEIIRNTYFITSVSATMTMVEFAAKVVPNRLLFGSDFPFNHCHDQETPLRALSSLNLPAEQFEAILGLTADRLFGFSLDKGEI